MLITIKTLNKLFKDKNTSAPVVVDGNCRACRNDMQVVIEKTSGGFGFLGGVLYEPVSNRFGMMCEDCFNAISDRSGSTTFDFDCCQKLFHVSNNREIFRQRLKTCELIAY